jgi:GntR family transcriptional repressor for pyruvate dehydrogenase complex
MQAFIDAHADAAGTAAECATEKQIDALRKRVDEMRAAHSDPLRYAEATLAFHRDVARTAASAAILKMLARAEHILRGWTLHLITSAESGTSASLREHVAIFEGIAAGDRAAARAAMASHLTQGLRQVATI